MEQRSVAFNGHTYHRYNNSIDSRSVIIIQVQFLSVSDIRITTIAIRLLLLC